MCLHKGLNQGQTQPRAAEILGPLPPLERLRQARHLRLGNARARVPHGQPDVLAASLTGDVDGRARELRAGQPLSFADVGELRWQGDHVVLVKDLESHQAVAERQPFRDVSASESSVPSQALTVRREASVRRLMEGGYSRDEALTALRTAEKYLDR